MSQEKLGKYTLIRQIAEGGMAEIWLAEQRGPGGFNKELVIKRILPHLAEEGDMTKMFFDEARIVAHLTHPNIGQVFELGEQDGDYFIAMEYIDGLDLVDLREQVDERDMTLPISYGSRIICDVLQALDYAHNYVDRDGNHVGLVHRDISPHNVLISNDGVVKLVDFGVAKAAINTHKTETGAVKGKFAYMAPEQIENGELDHRVDIFAVGVVFFELLTSKRPFGDDLQAVSKIISEERPDPRELRKDIPGEISEIILRALALDREDRFSTAAEMERAIENYLQGVDGVVGKRELSVMVHQLRDLEVKKPTEQMYGFQKHGVDRQEPRVTVREGDTSKGDRVTQVTNEPDANAGSAAAASVNTAVQFAGADAPATPKAQQQSAPANADVQSESAQNQPRAATQKSIPSAIQGQPAASPMPTAAVKPRGASVLTVLAFLVAMVVMMSGFGIASYMVLASAAAQTEPTQEPAQYQWQHAEEALVVFIDASEPSEVYYDGNPVGETPFQTYLRPGEYTAELRPHEGGRYQVTVSVEEDEPIQHYRFEF